MPFNENLIDHDLDEDFEGAGFEGNMNHVPVVDLDEGFACCKVCGYYGPDSGFVLRGHDAPAGSWATTEGV